MQTTITEDQLTKDRRTRKRIDHVIELRQRYLKAKDYSKQLDEVLEEANDLVISFKFRSDWSCDPSKLRLKECQLSAFSNFTVEANVNDYHEVSKIKIKGYNDKFLAAEYKALEWLLEINLDNY